MPRYSDELIEEVRSRNDIVDVISQCIDADIPRIMAFVHNCCKKF